MKKLIFEARHGGFSSCTLLVACQEGISDGDLVSTGAVGVTKVRDVVVVAVSYIETVTYGDSDQADQRFMLYVFASYYRDTSVPKTDY